MWADRPAGIVADRGLAARGRSPGRLNACPTCAANCWFSVVAQAVSPALPTLYDFRQQKIPSGPWRALNGEQVGHN
jgi:hypothetical protein